MSGGVGTFLVHVHRADPRDADYGVDVDVCPVIDDVTTGRIPKNGGVPVRKYPTVVDKIVSVPVGCPGERQVGTRRPCVVTEPRSGDGGIRNRLRGDYVAR